MSRIRQLIREDSKQVLAGANSVENSYLKTSDRLLIGEDNRAVLPSTAIGDVVWNIALIFENANTSVLEKEVTVECRGSYILFNEEDNVAGMYCTITYLTYKEQ